MSDLPPSLVAIRDGGINGIPEHHVSVVSRNLADMAGWAAYRGTGNQHEYTEGLLKAVIADTKIPKTPK